MCGILGTFVVVRRISLVGDTVSHSVLPGVVLGFLISSAVGRDRDPWIVFACSAVIGLLSILAVKQIISTTRLKADAALGIVLSGFFGIGLFMKRALKQFMDNAGGLDHFLFGNMAIISDDDLKAVLIVGLLMIICVSFMLRPFILVSFDPLFARTLGYPVKFLDLIFYTMLTITIVASLQAVGVILVSALLIIPASTAYLLTDEKKKMMWLSMLFGALAGIGGTLISANVERNIPNGAAITLLAAAIFGTAYLAAPKHGVIAKRLKFIRQKRAVASENILKAIYKLVEDKKEQRSNLKVASYAESHKLSLDEGQANLKKLQRAGFVELSEDYFSFTDSGFTRAQQIVRNHRLWELYLTKQAEYEADHVHDDAELIEHLLDEETVAKLEAELGFPKTDPHGKPIPQPSLPANSISQQN